MNISHDNATPDMPPADAAPALPVFFAESDLPDWLRTAPESPAPAPAASSSRARLAWGSADAPVAPPRTDDFRAIATTTLDHLVPQPAPPRRARRWSGLFSVFVVLAVMLAHAAHG